MRRSRGGRPGPPTLGNSQVSIENSNWTPPPLKKELEPSEKYWAWTPHPGEISWIHACRHVADKHGRVVHVNCFKYFQWLCAVFVN